LEREILERIDQIIEALQTNQPTDRNHPDGRAFAITITDLEKIRAYWLVAMLRGAPME
jgi:hypothetical protein